MFTAHTDGPSVSLCMIVRNEAANLSSCLDSVAGVVDEMVVVDTGSDDGTPALAAAHGARVICHPWADDFAQARNAGLVEARGAWILVLDADEELVSLDRPTLRRLVASAPWDGARVRIRNVQTMGELCGVQESRVARLFRNRPAYRYEGIVHEQIAPNILRAGGRVGDTDLVITHRGYARRTSQGSSDRATRNLRLLERALANAPEDPYLRYHYGATLKSIGAGQEARRALEQALRTGGEALGTDVLDLLHMKLAQLALADGRLPEAAAHARASLAVQPDNVLSLFALGLALLFAGDMAAAYSALLQARTVGATEIVQLSQLDAVLTYCEQQSLAVSSEKRQATPGPRP